MNGRDSERLSEGGDMPHAEGTHSDPVVSDIIAEQSDQEARQASRIDRMIRDYPIGHQRALRARYIGLQRCITIGHSVHGDIMRFRWDGETAYHTCDSRLGLKAGRTRTLVEEAQLWLSKGMPAMRSVRHGLTGNEGNIRAA